MQISIRIHNNNYAIAHERATSHTLNDLLLANKIPAHSVSIYATDQQGATSLICEQYTSLTKLANQYNELIIQPDRNIDLDFIHNKELMVTECINPSAEYTFCDSETNVLQHCQMSSEQCLEFVNHKVSAFLQQDCAIDAEKPIVLGVSGGGDSNTLISSFIQSGKVRKEQLVPVMMQGIPDWDKGISRAQKLCHDFGLELRVVTSTEVAQLLGVAGQDWLGKFEQACPETDAEVIGTLAIRVALKAVADKVAAQAVVVGLNLEDLLAESLFRVMQGKLPLPFPVRTIEELTLWYPLYQCPKKILDGCHPKFSLANYHDRYPSKMPGRAVPYYLAQAMSMVLPGAEYDLLRGLQKLSLENKSFYKSIAEVDFPVMDTCTLQGITAWKKFVKACAA